MRKVRPIGLPMGTFPGKEEPSERSAALTGAFPYRNRVHRDRDPVRRHLFSVHPRRISLPRSAGFSPSSVMCRVKGPGPHCHGTCTTMGSMGPAVRGQPERRREVPPSPRPARPGGPTSSCPSTAGTSAQSGSWCWSTVRRAIDASRSSCPDSTRAVSTQNETLYGR